MFGQDERNQFISLLKIFKIIIIKISTKQNGETIKDHNLCQKYFNLICSLEVTQLVETSLPLLGPTQLSKAHSLLGSKRYHNKV